MHKKQSSLLNTRRKDFLSVHAYRASSLLLFFSSFFFGPSFHPIFAALWQNILLDWRFMRNLLGFSQMLLSNKTKKLVALYQNQDEIWLHYCSHHHRFTRPFFVFFFVQFIQNAHVSMHLVYKFTHAHFAKQGNQTTMQTLVHLYSLLHGDEFIFSKWDESYGSPTGALYKFVRAAISKTSHKI